MEDEEIILSIPESKEGVFMEDEAEERGRLGKEGVRELMTTVEKMTEAHKRELVDKLGVFFGGWGWGGEGPSGGFHQGPEEVIVQYGPVLSKALEVLA